MATEIQKRIFAAMSGGDLVLMRELLEHHPEELSNRAAGKTWLDHAASSGDLEAVQLLVELGAEINPQATYRPLHFAMDEASIDLIAFLLEAGADPNHGRCVIGALNRRQEQLDAVRLLVEHGADVNRVFDLEGTDAKFTALDWTSDAELIGYLKSVGAKTSAELLATNGGEPDTGE